VVLNIIIRLDKLKTIRVTGHAALIGDIGRWLIRLTSWKIVYKWKACVEMDLRENEYEYVEWIIWYRIGSSVDACEGGNGPRDSIRNKAFLG